MSGFIPERVLEEIRFRNDIVDLISAYIPLKRSGSTFKACCPFHKEKTPSFNVNPNLQIFKCFGCGEGGDVISFMMKHQGLDFVAAARLLADRAGITIEVEEDTGEGARRKVLYEIHRGISQFYQRCLEQYPAAQKARDYIKERGLTGEAAAAFQIGYAPSGWQNSIKWGEKHGFTPDQLEQAGLVLRSSEEKDRRGEFYDRFRDRLIFPIQDSQGRVIAFSARLLVNTPGKPKYVNSPETPVFSKGKVLYGLDKARANIVNNPEREVIICEGQIDVVRCHLGGFPTAVAAQGTAFTDDHVQILKNYADSAVLVFDADSAGQAAAVKTARLMMKTGLAVRIARLPTGEDPDSFLRTQGSDAFRKKLETADSAVAFQIKILGEKEPDVRGIAATARIARAALETIVCTPNAVQRERLLQEASDLLGLPQHALAADLSVMEADIKTQEKRHSQFRAARGSSSGRVPAQRPAAAAGVPFTEVYDSEPPPEVLDLLRHSGSPAPSASNQTPPAQMADVAAPNEEKALCEHLAQGENEPDLAALVETFLPLDVLQDPLCRAFINLTLNARKQNTQIRDYILHENSGVDDSLKAFIRQLQTQPERIKKTGRDFTRQDAVQDLILGFWKRRLQKERKRLTLPGKNTDPQVAARRSQLTLDLKSLQHWETGQDVILIEQATPPPEEESA